MVNIGKDSQLTGRLEAAGPVTLQGSMVGTVACRSQVTIQAGGRWEGTIHARQVAIAGCMKGEVHAEEWVILEAGAEMEGLIRSPQVAIRRGARCNAHLITGEAARAPAEAAPPPTETVRDCA